MSLKRVPVVASMGFRAKGSFAKCGNKMAMDVRGDQDTLLLRQMGDAQRLGEARMPSRVELDVLQGAGIDKLADGETHPFAFAVGKWDRGGVGEAHISAG